VDNENDARILLRQRLFLPAQILPKLTGIQFYDHEVVGFTVLDTSYGEVGIIEDVIDLAINPLLQIKQGTKEVLIPLAANVVQAIDRKKKTMTITAPEGLIQLYLG
jgi:16S rRNA processing protein RimM